LKRREFIQSMSAGGALTALSPAGHLMAGTAEGYDASVYLEGNVIEHKGRLLVLPRVRMQFQATANMTALLEVGEKENQVTLRFLQFYPMPGGQNKFHIFIRGPSLPSTGSIAGSGTASMFRSV